MSQDHMHRVIDIYVKRKYSLTTRCTKVLNELNFQRISNVEKVKEKELNTCIIRLCALFILINYCQIRPDMNCNL